MISHFSSLKTNLGFEEVYSSRLKEINELISFVASLDVVLLEKDDEPKTTVDSLFSDSYEFYSENNMIVPEYSVISSVLRSNIYLMIYNLIEYTVTSLLQSLYDLLKTSGCTYSDVSDELKELWHHSQILVRMKDPNSKDSTILQISKYLLDKAINKSPLQIDARNTMHGGNLDGEEIKKTFTKHGIHINTCNGFYRPDLLSAIREKRNNLAHGSISFYEAGRETTVSDLDSLLGIVSAFLSQLCSDVEFYIEGKQYLSAH